MTAIRRKDGMDELFHPRQVLGFTGNGVNDISSAAALW
jgi:hypothetical protein